MKKKLHSESGLTFPEILIVLTIIAILSTLVVSQFAKSKTSLQRQGIAREFKVFLERARFDSVKRRASTVNGVNDMSRVILTSSSAFTSVLDTNQNGTILNSNAATFPAGDTRQFEPSDIRRVDFTQRSNTQITVLNTFNYPITILFNQRGQIKATDGAGNAVNPVFTICSSNCSDTSANNTNLTTISVSSTGTVAVVQNGLNPSALPTPVTTLAAPQFNCYVLVGNANTSGCINN